MAPRDWIAWPLLVGAAAAQVNFSTPNFVGAFAAGAGVLQSLRPVADTSFDFAPSSFYAVRNQSGQYHTGDLTLRYRAGNATAWVDADTAANRSADASATGPANGPWVSSLNAALSNATNVLDVNRTWAVLDGDLTLQFDVQNVAAGPVELGSLGLPIEVSNIFTTLTPSEITSQCALVDPYLGLDAGYMQVTRLTGTGPNLAITPLTNATKFEAWRFLFESGSLNDLGYQIQTYEGNYEYQIFSKAWAENEWNATTPWNPPTSAVLQPGQTLSVGLRFTLADTVEEIESTVAALGLPVAVGIPGYVLQEDLQGQLYLNTTKTVSSMVASPAGALTTQSIGTFQSTWQGYAVVPAASAFGRVLLTIAYSDGTVQTVHYWVTHSGPQALSEAGSFLTTTQWYNDTSDPFRRAPSILSYDHSVAQFVLQDDRSWIAGLCDEGGAGSFVAASMKQSAWPVAREVAALEAFVHGTLWGELQSKGEANWTVYGFAGNSTTYGVRKSLFFYQPGLFPGYTYSGAYDWSSAQTQATAYLIDRAYDYVHVSVVYWALYRAERMAPGILQQASAQWYLLQAYHTAMFAGGTSANGSNNTNYFYTGLLGETVWGQLLNDLQSENLAQPAAALAAAMQRRQAYWASIAEPFGSEQAWDCTGQEGVYYWSHYFRDAATVNRTIQSIRGYMPTLAHWGYNGNARRYWDFTTAGAYIYQGIERQIHHYGSGQNALPLLANYRNLTDPQSLAAIYDLRVGYGGHQGALTNVGPDGFGSMAFHAFPENLFWDPYSGDYGPNFLGHVLSAATYLLQHPIFGWVSFGGNLAQTGSTVAVQPRDSVRKRVFVAPLSLYVSFDAGMISNFTYDASQRVVTVYIEQGAIFGAAAANQTVMTVEQATGAAPVNVSGTQSLQNQGYIVTLPGTVTFAA